MSPFSKNVPSVFFVSLILLVNAQRASNNNRDLDFRELARQNKITKQILEAFLQKKLGVRSNVVKPPSVLDILPIKMPTEQRAIEQNDEEDLNEEVQDTQDYVEDDNLQSVESEQIDSFLDSIEGRKKYPTPPFEPELEPSSYRKNKMLTKLIIIFTFHE